MGSKIFLVLGLLVAIVLVITMEVAARDLAETSTNRKQNAEEATVANGIGDSKDTVPGYGDPGTVPGYGGGPGGGYGGYGDPGTVPGYGGGPGGGYGGGGYCPYGCCGGGYYGRGCRCCSYAGEAVEANTKAKPHN